MARALRLELAGGLYHVSSRGDGRDDICLIGRGREAWLEVLGKVCKRCNRVCHAWCQMTTHYHLLVEGQGPRTRVQVKFAGAGSKWLMLDMAGLTAA